MKIYHNPSCSKSRATLEILQNQGEEPEIVLYLENPPSEQELKAVLKKLNLKAEQLVRKSEPVFIQKYEGKTLTESQWIAAMVENPVLIERPIVVQDGKAVLGRPPGRVLDLF